jgi:hypothetical protein
MRNRGVRKLMGQVAQVYEESRSFHLKGVRESVLRRLQADAGGEDQTQREIEVWFQRPRLRLDGWNWLALVGILPGIEDETGPQMIVLDGDYEYRLSSGQWTRRKIWEGSPTLGEVVGLPLPPARVRHLTKDEAELSGRPMWVVRGTQAGIETTWWIDKASLTVAKFKKEQRLQVEVAPVWWTVYRLTSTLSA